MQQEYFYCKLVHEEAEKNWQTMALHTELFLLHLINFTHALTAHRKASKEALTVSAIMYKIWAK